MYKAQIDYDRQHLIDFCQKWKIIRLAFFGSVLRDDFNPNSDVDIMVAFDPDSKWSLLDVIEMKHELEDIFKRDVDILEEGTIRNPIKRRCIYENLEVIYESG